jgi:hypothetical protein
MYESVTLVASGAKSSSKFFKTTEKRVIGGDTRGGFTPKPHTAIKGNSQMSGTIRENDLRIRLLEK